MPASPDTIPAVARLLKLMEGKGSGFILTHEEAEAILSEASPAERPHHDPIPAEGPHP